MLRLRRLSEAEEKLRVIALPQGTIMQSNARNARACGTSAHQMEPDPINPAHYKNSKSGVECIEITQHMNFCLGNAMKYIWRAHDKGNTIEDLRKAMWYIDREITRLCKEISKDLRT